MPSRLESASVCVTNPSVFICVVRHPDLEPRGFAQVTLGMGENWGCTTGWWWAVWSRLVFALPSYLRVGWFSSWGGAQAYSEKFWKGSCSEGLWPLEGSKKDTCGTLPLVWYWQAVQQGGQLTLCPSKKCLEVWECQETPHPWSETEVGQPRVPSLVHSAAWLQTPFCWFQWCLFFFLDV